MRGTPEPAARRSSSLPHDTRLERTVSRPSTTSTQVTVGETSWRMCALPTPKSASTRSVRPRGEKSAASEALTIDFPVPPLPLATHSDTARETGVSFAARRDDEGDGVGGEDASPSGRAPRPEAICKSLLRVSVQFMDERWVEPGEGLRIAQGCGPPFLSPPEATGGPRPGSPD